MPKIAVLPGDGIGHEVLAEGLRVLHAVAPDLSYEHFDLGAERYLKDGTTMPDEVLARFRDEFDAVYLGALGDPRVPSNVHAKDILLGSRFKLDLYINFRPIRLLDARYCPLKDKRPEDVDMIIVRENTEDAYSGSHGFTHKGHDTEVAVQTMVYTRHGVERVIRYGFELARLRPRRQLTLIDKANAVRAQDLWTRTFEEVGAEYPGIARDHAYIDAACMWLVKNPEWFDVVVVGNMFGDILTDLGAMIQGGMGVAEGRQGRHGGQFPAWL